MDVLKNRISVKSSPPQLSMPSEWEINFLKRLLCINQKKVFKLPRLQMTVVVVQTTLVN